MLVPVVRLEKVCRVDQERLSWEPRSWREVAKYWPLKWPLLRVREAMVAGEPKSRARVWGKAPAAENHMVFVLLSKARVGGQLAEYWLEAAALAVKEPTKGGVVMVREKEGPVTEPEVAESETVKLPLRNGVPVIRPLVELKVKPAGRVPVRL